MGTKDSILIVDDDARFRKTMSDILRAKGYIPVATATAAGALRKCKEDVPAVAIVDLMLEDTPGLEVMRQLKQRYPDVECIVLTGYSSKSTAIEAVNLGAYSYLQKPLEMEKLLLVIRRAIDKRETQEALKASERRLSMIMKNLPGMAYRRQNDRDWTMVFISDGCLAITGYKPTDFIENRTLAFKDIVHPDDQELAWNQVQEALSHSQPFRIVYRIRTASGEEKWVCEQGAGIFSPRGSLLVLEGLAMDITELKKTEEGLKREKEKFQFLAEESPLGISLIGKNGDYKYVNPKFVEIFGYTLEEIPTGREWFRMAFPDKKYRKEVISRWIKDHEESNQGQVRMRQFTVRRKDGSKRTIRFRAVTVERGDQAVTYSDLTDVNGVESLT